MQNAYIHTSIPQRERHTDTHTCIHTYIHSNIHTQGNTLRNLTHGCISAVDLGRSTNALDVEEDAEGADEDLQMDSKSQPNIGARGPFGGGGGGGGDGGAEASGNIEAAA